MRHVSKWVCILGGLVAVEAVAALPTGPSPSPVVTEAVMASWEESNSVGQAQRPYGAFCHCPPQATDPTGCPPCDAGTDAGEDAGVDAGEDAGMDAGVPDSGMDAGDAGHETDAGQTPPDAGPPPDQIRYQGGGCSCGSASGTQAVLTVGLLTAVALLVRRRALRGPGPAR